jgi:hypothetical protein
VPGERLGRVFALDALGSQCLLPAGFALSGVVMDAFGAAWFFLGGGRLNLALSGIALSVRDVHEVEEGTSFITKDTKDTKKPPRT